MEGDMGKSIKKKDLGKGISQRDNGCYVGRYTDNFGKRRYIYDRNLKILEQKLDLARYEKKYGVFGTGESVTLDEFFETYIETYKVGKVKDTTVYRLRQTYAPCAKNIIGNMNLKDIRAIHIQMLINEMEAKGNSYGTISLLKSLLQEMFKIAIGNRIILTNPCDAIVLPKKVDSQRRFLDEKEQEMFLNAASTYAHFDIFCVSLSCGMRIGEVLGLKWSDIDFEHKTLHIQRSLHYSRLSDDDHCHFFFSTPKTEFSARKIPLLPETEEILERVREKQFTTRMLHGKKWHQEPPFEDLVFTTSQGSPVRYGDVNRTIKKAVEKANLIEEELAKVENREPYYIEDFSPHCFRHTFVTRCKKHGVSYETIQPYVGHSDKEMTKYYDHSKRELEISDFKGVSFF